MKSTGYIGKIMGKCRVCGTECEHDGYAVKEMFFGTKEEFLYFECGHCRCMQIKDVPDDIGKYYGDSYYSMEERTQQEMKFPKTTHSSVRILDVGCGTGKWLIEKAQEGLTNLYGCDPFIKEELRYADRIVIKKSTIHEMVGEFDLIVFNDSFEHMEDPFETLKSVKRLMSEYGTCRIAMPVYPNVAQETFGINWYQWDAPRHLILHSKQSMRYLCESVGLDIEKVQYASNSAQFAVSCLYEEGISLQQINSLGILRDMFDEESWQMFNRYTKKANENEYGDYAIFFLKHKKIEK